MSNHFLVRVRGLSSRLKVINWMIWLLPRWEGWQDFDSLPWAINTFYTDTIRLFKSDALREESGLLKQLTIDWVTEKRMKATVEFISRSFFFNFFWSQLIGLHRAFITDSDVIDLYCERRHLLVDIQTISTFTFLGASIRNCINRINLIAWQ